MADKTSYRDHYGDNGAVRGKVHCAPSARIPSEQEKKEEVFFVHVLDEMKLLCYSVK